MGTNLIIPHIVGNSGVLRNFSAYFAQLIDVQGRTDLQVSVFFNMQGHVLRVLASSEQTGAHVCMQYPLTALYAVHQI